MEYRIGTTPPDLGAKRVHDVVGVSARAFAVMRAGQGAGSVVWIERAFGCERPYPQGLAPFFDPDRLIAVGAGNRKETLWCMQEALRETSALVVAILPEPADLMESRRLQLAAEVGGSTGLCLTSDTPVNNAAETRWRSTPLSFMSVPGAKESTLHRWELIKNKKGILGCWDVGWNTSAHSLTVVSASGGGARLAERRNDRSAPPVRSGRDAQKRLAALLDQRGG